MDSSASPPSSSSSPLQLSGIPFSWEKLPGIPKKQSYSSSNESAIPPSSKTSLPPPPQSSSSTTTTKKLSKKPSLMKQTQWDPFVAALVQCSRDPDSGQRCHDHEKDRNVGRIWTVSKVPRRSIGDWLGFLISLHGYGSCKVSSAVSDSTIYGPSGPHQHR